MFSFIYNKLKLHILRIVPSKIKVAIASVPLIPVELPPEGKVERKGEGEGEGEGAIKEGRRGDGC